LDTDNTILLKSANVSVRRDKKGESFTTLRRLTMNDWFDTVMKSIFTLVFAFISGVIILILATGVYNFSGYSCKNVSEILGLEYKHNWDNGCFLKVNGTFVPRGELAFVERDGKMVIVTKAQTQHRVEVKEAK